MAQYDRKTEVMRQYLLGALSEAEQEALEAKYLSDDNAFEEMVRVEHQLVDSYVQDRLAPEERTRFEQHYMAHPDRRERVQFAAVLQKKIRLTHHTEAATTQQPESDSLWQKMLAFLRGDNLGLIGAFAVAMLVLAVGMGYYIRYLRPGQEIDPNIAKVSPPPVLVMPSPVLPSVPPDMSPSPNASPAKGNGNKKPSELPPPSLPPIQSQTPVMTQPSLRADSAFLLLTPGASVQNAAQIKLAGGIRQVRLQLNLERLSYATYRAAVRTLEGQVIWEQQNLQSRPTNGGSAFIILLPVSRFTTGTYQVSLSGVSDNGAVTEITNSFFKVAKP